MSSLTDKVCVVTGAASGIGACIARTILAGGAKGVVIADIQEKNGLAFAAELGSQAHFVHCDVTKEEDIAAAVDAAVEKWGKLDVLVNCAGCVGRNGPLLKLDAADYEQLQRINATSVLLGSKQAARAMLATGVKGSIINISSVAGIRPGVYAAASYTVAKTAVIALTKQAAVEFGPVGIRVNCVCPGPVDTPMTRHLFMGSSDIPLPPPQDPSMQMSRELTATDVANTVAFLASDASKGVNAQVIAVDNGISSGVGVTVPMLASFETPMVLEAGRVGTDGTTYAGMISSMMAATDAVANAGSGT